MNWIEKYVGLPFIDGGRDWSGVDCWGLVRLVLKTECGIEVPSYGEISAHDLMLVAREVSGESSREPWCLISQPEIFDVAVMFKLRAPVHVGIVAALAPVRLLHIEKATSAVFIIATHPSVAFRSIVYHRHKDLVNAAACSS
jgi:hypothetical protein